MEADGTTTATRIAGGRKVIIGPDCGDAWCRRTRGRTNR